MQWWISVKNMITWYFHIEATHWIVISNWRWIHDDSVGRITIKYQRIDSHFRRNDIKEVNVIPLKKGIHLWLIDIKHWIPRSSRCKSGLLFLFLPVSHSVSFSLPFRFLFLSFVFRFLSRLVDTVQSTSAIWGATLYICAKYVQDHKLLIIFHVHVFLAKEHHFIHGAC